MDSSPTRPLRALGVLNILRCVHSRAAAPNSAQQSTRCTVEKLDDVSEIHVVLQDDVSVHLHQGQGYEEHVVSRGDVSSSPDGFPDSKDVVIHQLCEQRTAVTSPLTPARLTELWGHTLGASFPQEPAPAASSKSDICREKYSALQQETQAPGHTQQLSSSGTTGSVSRQNSQPVINQGRVKSNSKLSLKLLRSLEADPAPPLGGLSTHLS